MTSTPDLALPEASAPVPSVLFAEVAVAWTERVSPALVRVGLTAPALADLAVDGFDTRFKLLLPHASGALPPLPTGTDGWYAAWQAMPDDVRAPMRTYTVRDVTRSDAGEVTLVVDLVVHEGDPDTLGPACRWALTARPGDRVQVAAPHVASPYGGTEFDPADARHVLLVGDETAVPAISRILLDAAPGLTGDVFVEVPGDEDILHLSVPEGWSVRWLPRHQGAVNRRLVQEVRRHLGLGPRRGDTVSAAQEVTGSEEVDLWETPTFSSAGEDVEAQLHTSTHGHDLADTYAWIAGESWMVRTLRRSLVGELGVERSRVAFMGYWREGVAMRS